MLIHEVNIVRRAVVDKLQPAVKFYVSHKVTKLEREMEAYLELFYRNNTFFIKILENSVWNQTRSDVSITQELEFAYLSILRGKKVWMESAQYYNNNNSVFTNEF